MSKHPVNPTIRNMHRRANWHDYKAPSLYLITMTKSAELGDLATLSHPNGNYFRSNFTDVGRIAARFIESMERYHRGLKTWKYVVMPDHVHFLLQVKDYLPKNVGYYIMRMKTDCTLSYRSIFNPPEHMKEVSYFSENFHDRIVIKPGQADIVKKYIADNPRRLWIKLANPDLFSRRILLSVCGTEFEAIGNQFLLDDFDKEAVIFSRKYGPDELKRIKTVWLHTIHNGGVLVSPFVHPTEKSVRDYAFDNCGRAIILIEKSFGERYKPPGRMFDLCAAGRLLLVAPKEELTWITTARERCLFLNDISRRIAVSSFQ